MRGGQQPLDVAHRAHQPLALRGRQRRQERRGELGRAAVEQRPLREPGGREPRGPHAAIAVALVDGHHPVGLERAQQAAGVAGVEPEPAAQRAHLAPVRPDLPQHARLGERAVAREIVIVERPDALRDGPVEAADLLDHLIGHYLTLVRYRGGIKRSASLLARWRDSSVGRAHD